jgi:hypothetical protein
MSYILSNNNRFYVALEQAYGHAAVITAANRIPAVKLTTKVQTEKIQRRDKTGSRTFAGNPAGLRTQSSFSLKTYMTNWADQTTAPPHGPLFQACLGNSWTSAGGVVAGTSGTSNISFAGSHGLNPGQAVASGGELRFVAAVLDSHTVQLNAPFSVPPNPNTQTGATVAYGPAGVLPSATLYDYWSPSSAVQRVLGGMAFDTLTIKVNGDFHEFDFTGPAQDLVDTGSFEAGQFGMSSFPAEPEVEPISYSIIPGHLGQVWVGSTPSRFLTLTSATVSISNNIELRAREFGATLPRAISPGERIITVNFGIYQLDDEETASLYQAARQRSPISVMIQLGQQQGELFGIYMKSVVPQVPIFDDSERRQQWHFQSCRAQGSVDDEVFVAFA